MHRTEGSSAPRGGSRLSRRQFLGGLVAGASLSAGCQPGAAPPSPQTAPQSGGAPAAPAAGAAWDELVARARQEGSLVISGPPTPSTRQELPAVFKNRFGIEVEYFAPGSTTSLLTRLIAERSAGLYTVDAIMGGAQSLFTTGYDARMYDPLLPALIHPEAIDTSKWINGRLWFMDPEQQYILRLSNFVSLQVVVNAEHVRPAEIRTWNDLLDPRYRGKISAYEPAVAGTGWNRATYLLRVLGDTYIRTLYQDQQPGISREPRQLSDWLARGTYPISLGLSATQIEPLRADGFPVELVLRDLPDAPGVVSAGFGLGVLLNNAPHPNAARLFLNWMAMREGQEVWNRSQENVSVRTDVDNAWAPEYTIPKPGVDYFDIHGWEYTLTSRSPEEQERMRQLTGRTTPT